jgi:hypothetical protein
MSTRLNFRAVSLTTFIALLVSYLLCVTNDQLFGWRLVQIWAPLLPGFPWPLTARGFLLGLIWLAGYSLYAAVLIVLPNNALIQRQAPACRQLPKP